MSVTRPALNLNLKSVLLATDLSSASTKPLHHALDLARHFEAKLHVAHVVSPVPYLVAGPESLELAYEGASKDLHQLQQDLLHDGSLDALDHEFIIRMGRVWEELRSVICEKQIDLVIVGTHGRRGIQKLLLGSVAEKVFRYANCPVLSIGPHSYREGRAEPDGTTRSFLFATDFSEASLRALALAASLASRHNAKLILVHVVPAPLKPQIPGWYSASELVLMRENARTASMRRLEQLLPCDEQTPIETELIVPCGIPSERILQLALERGIDLIILGLRRAPLVLDMLWATAYEIVCGAACPVLTVRE